MPLTQINHGTFSNDGTGDLLSTLETTVDSNLSFLTGELNAQIADRTTKISDCAKKVDENVYTSPNGFLYQIVNNSSLQMDFTIDAPNNFYVTYGEGIHLVTPIGLASGVHQSGWIITQGAITNWDDIFVNGESHDKPIDDASFDSLSLYEYHVISEDVIVFKKQFSDRPIFGLLEVTIDSVVENIKLMNYGVYETQIVIDWSPDPASIPKSYRITIQNSLNETLLDAITIETTYTFSPVVDFGSKHKVTIYSTDGVRYSDPAIAYITPLGDTTEAQEETIFNVTIGTDSILGKDNNGVETFRLDSDDGSVHIGNPDKRSIVFDPVTSEFTFTGTMKVEDIDVPFDEREFGMFITGDASYSMQSGAVSGTGVIFGTPGLYTVKDGEFSFCADNDGNVSIGDINKGRLRFSSAASELALDGTMQIKDVLDNLGAVTQYGFIATGTADYDIVSDAYSGSGILMGTPGIFGISNGDITFKIDASTGDIWMKSDKVNYVTKIYHRTTYNSQGDPEDPILLEEIDITMDEHLCMIKKCQKTADLALKRILEWEFNH